MNQEAKRNKKAIKDEEWCWERVNVLGKCLIFHLSKTRSAEGRYTLVEILYLGDMLLWNQMKLKMTPMVLGMRSL